MSKPKRFRKGNKVLTVATLAKGICEGRWFFVGSVPKHPSFLGSMQLLTLKAMILHGRVHTAIEVGPKTEIGRHSYALVSSNGEPHVG